MSKFEFPAEVLGNHTAVLGKTGGGKTFTSKLLVETAVAKGARVCVLDTIKSDWWGLTSSADGKKPGLPFKILGGPRGHTPLHSGAGKAIGELVGTGKLPLSIIDMADFEPGGLQRFFVDFAQSLWKHVRGVVYLVIEEAHEIAPKERAGFGSENLSIHWAKKLATGSRTKGIRLIVCTQRTQSLHNAVLGSCETLVAHRMTLDADQEQVLKWLKNHNKAVVGEVAESLASLPTGTGWLCSGEAKVFERVAFPRIKTYDNGATPTGDGTEIEVKTAPVDPDELRAIIGDAVKEAVANDPKTLKAEIARLNKLVGAKPTIQIPPSSGRAELAAEYTRGRNDGLEAGEIKGRSSGYAEALSLLGPLVETGRAVAEIGQKLGVELKKIMASRPAKITPPATTSAPVAQRIEHSVPDRKAAGSSPAGRASNGHGHGNGHGPGDESIGQGGLRRIMIALAQCPDGLTNRQIGVRATLSSKSGTFSTYLSRGRSQGWIEDSGQLRRITPAGIDALGTYEPLPTGQALLDYWLNDLGAGGAGRLLRVIADAYPDKLSNAEAGERANLAPTSGTFGTYLSRLRTLELVTGRGELQASEDLFG